MSAGVILRDRLRQIRRSVTPTDFFEALVLVLSEEYAGVRLKVGRLLPRRAATLPRVTCMDCANCSPSMPGVCATCDGAGKISIALMDAINERARARDLMHELTKVIAKLKKKQRPGL